MKRVILISGKLRSGKNQLAEYIKENLSKKYTVETDLFAKGVKDGSKEDFKELQKYLNEYSGTLKKDIRFIFDDMCNWISSFGLDMLVFKNRLDEIYKRIDSLKIEDENWYENKTEITRRILQLYGTEIFRKRIDDNYWINQTKERVLNSKVDFIIITDVRFPNEIEHMHSNDYELITVRVERNNVSDNPVNEHDSEKALDNYNEFCYFVNNSGTLQELKDSAKIITEEFENAI